MQAARPKINGDSSTVDDAVQYERERCAELAEMVAARPDTFCQRRGPDCVGTTIAMLIRAGYTADMVPELEG